MVVRAGREFLAIPGPTTIPDEVLAAMHRPAVDIYSGSLVATTDGLLADLKRIFRTDGHAYIYIANGHGTWEAALTNVLSPGDRVLVLVSGRFAAGWGATAEGIGIGIETIDDGAGQADGGEPGKGHGTSADVALVGREGVYTSDLSPGPILGSGQLSLPPRLDRMLPVPRQGSDHVELVPHVAQIVDDRAHELASRRAVGFEMWAENLDLHVGQG